MKPTNVIPPSMNNRKTPNPVKPRLHRLLFAAPFALLAACAAPKGPSFLDLDPHLGRVPKTPASKGILLEEYEALISTGAVPKARLPVLMQMSVKEPSSSLVTSPRVELGIAKISVELVRELRYVSEFDPARAGSGGFPVTPATPAAFKTRDLGIVATLTAKEFGSLILVEGEISVTQLQGFSRTGGALGAPILDEKGRTLTENLIQLPKFAVFTTPVYVAIEPGKSSTFEISAPRKGTTVSIALTQKNEGLPSRPRFGGVRTDENRR